MHRLTDTVALRRPLVLLPGRSSAARRASQTTARPSVRPLPAARRVSAQSFPNHARRQHAGTFVTYLVPLMCLYGFCLRSASSLIERTGESTPVTVTLLLIFAGSLFAMVRRSGQPLRLYGLTTEGWKPALKESLLWSAGFVAGLTLLKLVVLAVIPGMSGQHLFSLRGFVKYTPMTSLGIAASYSIFAPVQEFVARGALQSSFQQLLTGKRATVTSILLSTFLFSTTHLHLSLGYALSALVPSVLWGFLFARQKTLVGVAVSHVLIGLYVAFFLGAPAFPASH